MRFECQPGCTKCCDQEGLVYLSEDDLVRLAAFTGMDVARFERRYVVRTTNILRLRKPRNRQCPFLLADGCSVHAAKPTQCRTFPFWPELLDDPKELDAAARYCPGIGKGELVNITLARKEADAMRAAVPHQYE
jgi:Fe-S-cluster containining protein